jgi:hypothetical protein
MNTQEVTCQLIYPHRCTSPNLGFGYIWGSLKS